MSLKTRICLFIFGAAVTFSGCDSAPADESLPPGDIGPNLSDGPISTPTDALTGRQDLGGLGMACTGCVGRQTCDQQTGACMEPDPCSADEDCLVGRICEDTLCIDGCSGADNQCAADLVCHVDGRCAEASPCESQRGCFEGRLCMERECAAPCTEDAICPGRQICNLETGRCELNGDCVSDADCPTIQICVQSACIPGCSERAPCPGTQGCEDGACLEPAVCGSHDDCIGNRMCINSQCAAPCVEDADCPGARLCHVESGLCPEPLSCEVDLECDPGRMCTAGTCTNPCAPGDCLGAQECQEQRCVEPARCIGDLDCIGERICSRERCAEPCQEDAHCLGSDVCDRAMGRCIEFLPECAIDDDCPQEHACILGACREGVCAEHQNCDEGEECIDGVCAPALRPRCRVRNDCDAGHTCASFGVCVLASPCGQDEHCDGNRPVCWLGQCTACRVDADCTPSEGCNGGRCVSHGLCARDADCPGMNDTCFNARCTPAPCDGDELDLRLDIPRLAARTYTDLVLCNGDTDHYAMEVGPGQGMTIKLDHDPVAGDLQVVLRSLGNEAVGVSQNGIVRAGFSSAGPPRMIDIFVTGRAGFRTPYQLDLRRTTVNDCIPDNLEPPLGNDLQGLATRIGAGHQDVVTHLCAGDIDWLNMMVPGGVTARVTLSSDNLAAVNASLHSDAGVLLSEAINDGRNKTVVARPESRSRYGIKLTLAPGGGSANNTVSITVESGPDAPRAACTDASRATLAVPYWFSPQLSADRFVGACNAPSRFFDRVVRFRIENAGQHQIDSLQNDRNSALIIRTECPGIQQEIQCVQGSSLGPIHMDVGEYYLILDSAIAGPQGVFIRRVEAP